MTNIIINFQIEGIHVWEEAAVIEPKMYYLQFPHRHIFHITCKKNVFHDNRDIEFIKYKREIKKYLESYYDNSIECANFLNKSCEIIAKELVEKFDLCYCSVLEDNENGAEYFKQK